MTFCLSTAETIAAVIAPHVRAHWKTTEEPETEIRVARLGRDLFGTVLIARKDGMWVTYAYTHHDSESDAGSLPPVTAQNSFQEEAVREIIARQFIQAVLAQILSTPLDPQKPWSTMIDNLTIEDLEGLSRAIAKAVHVRPTARRLPDLLAELDQRLH